MREIDITEECLDFIDNQDERVSLNFFQLIEVMGELWASCTEIMQMKTIRKKTVGKQQYI